VRASLRSEPERTAAAGAWRRASASRRTNVERRPQSTNAIRIDISPAMDGSYPLAYWYCIILPLSPDTGTGTPPSEDERRIRRRTAGASRLPRAGGPTLISPATDRTSRSMTTLATDRTSRSITALAKKDGPGDGWDIEINKRHSRRKDISRSITTLATKDGLPRTSPPQRPAWAPRAGRVRRLRCHCVPFIVACSPPVPRGVERRSPAYIRSTFIVRRAALS